MMTVDSALYVLKDRVYFSDDFAGQEAYKVVQQAIMECRTEITRLTTRVLKLEMADGPR
jgi:hypothetical protein